MKKLNKLYEAIDDEEIKYTKVGEDPETGSIEWNVSYEKKAPETYEFKESHDDLNELVEKIVELRGGMDRRDKELDALILTLKNIRNLYTRYLTEFHPNWNKK
jgi:hypothetical protein